MVLNAQMGKAGPPMDGKDLHVGDFDWGILPPVAPLAIADADDRRHGDGVLRAKDRAASPSRSSAKAGSSLGEWHEAINAVRRAAGCRRSSASQNNQTALSTPVREQSAVRVFADKAIGYGIPGITIDGTDPDAIAAAFAWAAERARDGPGPRSSSSSSMRMCGHAHHDDMLYLGKDPQPSWEYPPLDGAGLREPRALRVLGGARSDSRVRREARSGGLIAPGDLDRVQARGRGDRRSAGARGHRRAVAGAGARPASACSRTSRRACTSKCSIPAIRLRRDREIAALPALEPVAAVRSEGKHIPRGVMLGVGDALRADPRVFVYGEDVGGNYGNAFLLLRPLLKEFGDRIINSPLAEGAVLGVCVGAALAGQRPIGEIQFNDFVATGFNQLVNNAAKIRYRWGGERADGRADAVGRAAARRVRTIRRTPRRGSIARRA